MSAVIDRSAAVARDLNNDRAFEAWLEDDKCMKWLDERGDEAPEAQKARAAALHVTSRGAFSMDQCERMATEEEFRRLAAEDIECLGLVGCWPQLSLLLCCWPLPLGRARCGRSEALTHQDKARADQASCALDAAADLQPVNLSTGG